MSRQPRTHFEFNALPLPATSVNGGRRTMRRPRTGSKQTGPASPPPPRPSSPPCREKCRSRSDGPPLDPTSRRFVIEIPRMALNGTDSEGPVSVLRSQAAFLTALSPSPPRTTLPEPSFLTSPVAVGVSLEMPAVSPVRSNQPTPHEARTPRHPPRTTLRQVAHKYGYRYNPGTESRIQQKCCSARTAPFQTWES